MEIDNISVLRLEAGSAEDIKNVLKELVEKNSQRFTFTELNQDNKRKKIWNILFTHLDRPSSAVCHKECLAAVRMLSRDKTDVDKIMTEKWVELLLSHAGLSPQEHGQHHLVWHNLSEEKYQIMVEAQKALCNLIYNCEKVQSICKQNKCVEEIVMRLRLFKEPDLPHDIKYFDVRMLFIITALCPETRERLKDELHGLTYLMETLDLIMNEATVEGSSTIILNEDQVTLASEVLKVLFNLMAKSCTPQFDEEEDAHFLRLEVILKNLLLCKTEPKENIDSLHSHIVNLLTTMPGSCHKELISIISPNDPPKVAEYDGKNMEAVAILIDFLDKRLNGVSSGNLKSVQDLVSPILTVLIECARSESILRKYLRLHILPPLRDVKSRPEEGDKLRNKLCRLLTSAVTNVRDLAAELLFILCKENVARMIKYTGYGNAAGMFANRGLLGNRRRNSGNFSSNSEDSDTEEYAEYRDRINPVVGCYEPPRPDPMASMTEEQKEYEALKLANMMDKLARDGLLQPARIGEDGRPQPVDHILQLQEDLPKQENDMDNDD